jgi:hypothetical protein
MHAQMRAASETERAQAHERAHVPPTPSRGALGAAAARIAYSGGNSTNFVAEPRVRMISLRPPAEGGGTDSGSGSGYGTGSTPRAGFGFVSRESPPPAPAPAPDANGLALAQAPLHGHAHLRSQAPHATPVAAHGVSLRRSPPKLRSGVALASAIPPLPEPSPDGGSFLLPGSVGGDEDDDDEPGVRLPPTFRGRAPADSDLYSRGLGGRR